MHIISESVLMLFTQKCQKSLDACWNNSLPKLARFLRHSVYIVWNSL